jgi:hypothetical protein
MALEGLLGDLSAFMARPLLGKCMRAGQCAVLLLISESSS